MCNLVTSIIQPFIFFQSHDMGNAFLLVRRLWSQHYDRYTQLAVTLINKNTRHGNSIYSCLSKAHKSIRRLKNVDRKTGLDTCKPTKSSSHPSHDHRFSSKATTWEIHFLQYEDLGPNMTTAIHVTCCHSYHQNNV